MAATVPYMLLIRNSISDMGPWSRVDTIAVGLLTVFFGIPAGLMSREIFMSDEDRGKRR
jgi:hypothetical protein